MFGRPWRNSASWRRRNEAIKRPNDFGAEQALKVLVAGMAVALVAAKILGGFGTDWRPSHFDEWRSVALAQRALESGALAFEEPVGSPNGLARDISDRNRSLGFVAVVSAWVALVPEPITRFKGLALAFLLLYAAGVYALCRSVGVRPWAVLPAVLALATLPTDTMLLGPALAVPSSLSLGLLCFALVAHLRLRDSPAANRAAWWVTLIGTCAALAVVYPLSLIVFGGLVLTDCLVRPELLRSRYAKVMGALGLCGFVVFLWAEWHGDFATTGRHLADLFLLDQRWHLVELMVYTLDYLVSPPLLLLAFAGAVLCLLSPDQRWLAATFLGPLLALGGYHFMGAGLVVPYQRVGLFLAFGATLCAAVAVERGLVLIESWRASAWLRLIFVAALCGLIVGVPRPSPPFKRTTRLERPPASLEAIARKLAREHAPPERIHAQPRESMFLEALTGLRAAPASLDSLLTGAPPPVLECDAGWEIVVGPCPCPDYAMAFHVAGTPVFLHRPALGDERRATE